MMQDNGMMSGLTKHPETKHRLVMSESSKITANKYYFNRRRSLKEEVEEGEGGSVTHNISLSSISFSLISLSALPNTLSLTFLFPFNRELFAFIRYKFRNRNPPLYNRSNGSLILFLFDCEIDYVSSYREVEERERGGNVGNGEGIRFKACPSRQWRKCLEKQELLLQSSPREFHHPGLPARQDLRRWLLL